MSLLNVTAYALPTLLLRGALDISFWTTKEQVAAGTASMHQSDADFKDGNMTGAIHHFYAAYCPQVEDEEKEYVLKYLQGLSTGGGFTIQATKSKLHTDMQCLVFGICPQPEIRIEKSVEVIERNTKSSDGAALHWVFSLSHLVAKRTLEELAFRFAHGQMTDHINDYLRAGNPRSYCFNGACLSWHHDILTNWNPQTAAYVVNNALAAGRALQYLSAKSPAYDPAGVQAFCVSNRPTGC